MPFTIEKAIVKIIFNFLWHYFGLLGCKRMIRSHFSGGVSEQDDMQKGWCKEIKYW